MTAALLLGAAGCSDDTGPKSADMPAAGQMSTPSLDDVGVPRAAILGHVLSIERIGEEWDVETQVSMSPERALLEVGKRLGAAGFTRRGIQEPYGYYISGDFWVRYTIGRGTHTSVVYEFTPS